MDFTLSEIAKLAAVGVGLLLLALSIVHFTKQKIISRSVATSLMICVRFAIVYVGLFWFWCALLRMPVNTFLTLLGIWLGVVALVCLVGSGDELLGAAIGIVLAIPLFLLLSFIYGPAVFHLFVLRPPEAPAAQVEKPNDPEEHLNAIGIVVATLKPTGTIQINGNNHSAATEDGKLLNVGATVEVCSFRNRIMLVRVVEKLET